ncbi:uncharacterized protein BX664DRAFT_292299 [Halteromyces radiatus]|uniref:uncharacterized protein n=1 Tax=Halteromyces radiatus TaxID=101107 RepID=UPI0022212125|nr:uncharacterized protein BX664DRAFT_292299 [Halteromyces radiatus]KAI8097026.1 hypothetical protein BX664DRAFT_292299 [Halteromyces radiatus]
MNDYKTDDDSEYNDDDSEYNSNDDIDTECSSTVDYPVKSPTTTATKPPAKKRSRIIHPCPYDDCDRVFTQKPKLTDHIRSHTGEKPFACPFPNCNKTYRRKGQLTVHCRLHDPATTRTLKCDQCEQAFNLKHHLQRHKEKIHQVPLSFRCQWPDCTAAYAKKYQLRRHMCIHTNKKPHPCNHPGCEASFDYKSRLQYHQDTVHSAIQRYICTEPGCNMKFTKWSQLQTHVNTGHPVECDVCHKQFGRQALLNRHIKGTHMLKEEVHCEWEGCTRVFRSLKSLKRHINVNHAPLPRFKCMAEECGQIFHYRCDLVKHSKSHKKKKMLDIENNKNESTTLMDDPVAEPIKNNKQRTLTELLTGYKYDDNKRKYVCPFEDCNHKFFRQYDLERHIQSKLHKLDVQAHSGEDGDVTPVS